MLVYRSVTSFQKGTFLRSIQGIRISHRIASQIESPRTAEKDLLVGIPMVDR